MTLFATSLDTTGNSTLLCFTLRKFTVGNSYSTRAIK